MAVEILRKKDDGTMEKLDIGGEAELEPTGAANIPVYIDEDGKPQKCFSETNLALGDGATATGASSTAVGATASTGGNSYSTAMGYYARCTSNYGVANGEYTQAAINGTAVGANAQATGSGSTACGSNTTASGSESIAIGRNAKATEKYDIAFGTQTRGAKNKGIYLDGGLVTETDEFMTADTIAKMTTSDVDALFV